MKIYCGNHYFNKSGFCTVQFEHFNDIFKYSICTKNKNNTFKLVWVPEESCIQNTW